MKEVVSARIIRFNKETGNFEILLEKHTKCKGLYVMPSGKLEITDLDLEYGLKRELSEELGLDIILLDNLNMVYDGLYMTTYDRIDGIHTFYEHVFKVPYTDYEIKNLEPEKHSEICFVPLRDIISYCESNIKDGEGHLLLNKYSFLVYQMSKKFFYEISKSIK